MSESGIEAVHCDGAPKAIGPYSQAVSAGGFVFVSGQIGMDPSSGTIVEGGVREQTMRALKNITAILESCGVSMENVVKADVFLKDMDDFAAVNDVYASFFPGDVKPSRAAVQVSKLPRDVLVEISCVAYRKG